MAQPRGPQCARPKSEQRSRLQERRAHWGIAQVGCAGLACAAHRGRRTGSPGHADVARAGVVTAARGRGLMRGISYDLPVRLGECERLCSSGRGPPLLRTRPEALSAQPCLQAVVIPSSPQRARDLLFCLETQTCCRIACLTNPGSVRRSCGSSRRFAGAASSPERCWAAALP